MLERTIQRSIFSWYLLTKPDFFLFAIPNGGKMSVGARKVSASMGEVGGVSDYGLIFPNNRVAFIEIKRPDIKQGVMKDDEYKIVTLPCGKQSKSQKEFEKTCINHSIPYIIVYSLDGFISIANILTEQYKKEDKGYAERIRDNIICNWNKVKANYAEAIFLAK